MPREIFLGCTESKYVIDVNINAIGEGVNLKRYTLEDGDMITYDITSEGKVKLNISFYENGRICKE